VLLDDVLYMMCSSEPGRYCVVVIDSV
jgi:hypothetical protein